MHRIRQSILALEAFVVLVFVNTALRLCGLNKVLRSLEFLLSNGGPVRRVDQLTIDEMVTAYAFALRYYWRKVECLPKSLTLFVMTRRRNLPTTFCIGVRKYPFTSHAWVELDAPLSVDDREFVRVLTPIYKLK